MLGGATIARTAHFALHCVKFNPAVHNLLANGAGASRQAAPFPVNGVWMGALVPKRWARRAVTRSTIKRQIYTVSQEVALTLQEAAHVVRLRAAFDRKQFRSATSEPLKVAVRQELQQLFAAARRLATASARSGAA